MRKVNPALLLAATTCGPLMLVAACAPQSTHPNVVVVRETRNVSIAAVLSYADNVLSLDPQAQISARNSLARQFQLTQFPEDRMRLALLDTLLPAPARDDAEATALLAGYNWSAQGPGFKGLAGALMQVLNDRKTRAKAAADAAQQRSRLEQQLAAERAEKTHLQQQLEALERIEKTVNKRATPTAPAVAGTRSSIPPSAITRRPVPAASSHGD